MDKFLYTDGSDVCLYDNGKITKNKSKFIENYKNTALNVERSRSWKHSGEGAQFRGDVRPGEDEISIAERINGVYMTSDEAEAVYSFTVNQTSGIYKMRFDDEKAAEVHIINSIEYEFSGGCLDCASEMLAISVKRNFCNSDIALFDMKSGDYKVITDGDTLDEDPFISPKDANIVYFSSRGTGRDGGGNFAGFSPAAICKLDIAALTVDEVAVSEKYGYIKPVFHGGKLYAIRIPAKEKGANPLIEIALIPFRIIQAIANFINVFVTFFTGKSLASGGSNPAKGRKYDSREEFVKGNLINAEKEMKKNAKKNKGDYGFIPLSWQLVEVETGKVIKSGIADYDILSDGTIIATNGRRVFAIKDGDCKKIAEAERCLCVAAKHESVKKTELFEF